jgi:flagellar motility protein MotE (MotC chaperone)
MENLLKKSDYFELSEVDRVNQLNLEAEKVTENYHYSRPLSNDEITQKNLELNQALQEIERIKEEITELNAQKKEQNKIVMSNHKEVISKFVQKTGKVWEVINTATGMIEFINHEGYIVEEKRIKSASMVNMFKKSKSAM